MFFYYEFQIKGQYWAKLTSLLKEIFFLQEMICFKDICLTSNLTVKCVFLFNVEVMTG